MYTGASEECKSVIQRSSRTFAASLIADDTTYSEIQKITLRHISAVDGQPCIGTTASNSVEIIMKSSDLFINGQKISIKIAPKLDDGTYEDIPMGKYWITKATVKDGMATLTAGGALSTRANGAYFSELTYPADARDMLLEISESIGVDINIEGLEEKVVNEKPSGYTNREMIGYIAGIYGKFATEERDGSISLKWYEHIADDITTGKINEPEIELSNFEISKITCSVSNDLTYTVGTGATGLNIENPLMTQEYLEAIWESIGGFYYRPCTMEMLSGNPLLDAWDSFNYGIYKIICACLTYVYDGGLQADISSKGKSESEANFKGPVASKIARQAIEIALINEALIKTLTVDEADIRYFRSDQMDAIEANIKTAVIVSLSSEFITTDMANIDKSKMGELLSDIGLITSATMVDGHVTGYLDSVQINANSITAGTIVADRILLSGNNQSILYALNNLGELTSTNVDTLDGSVLTERSISPDRIVAQSITSNELAAGCITSEKILSKAITADKLNVLDLSAISANLGTVTAGVIKSSNYIKDESGMMLDLATGTWDSKHCKINSDGSVEFTKGVIGGWSIFEDGLDYEDGEIEISIQTPKANNNNTFIACYQYDELLEAYVADAYWAYNGRGLPYINTYGYEGTRADIQLIYSSSIYTYNLEVYTSLVAKSIQTTAGVNLDALSSIVSSHTSSIATLNSNLSNCIKYLGTYTFSMTVQSTKSLGRGQEYTVTLNKNYPSARFGVITQSINGDWVVINLKEWKDTQHPVLTYQNFYTAALSGNVSIHIYGY